MSKWPVFEGEKVTISYKRWQKVKTSKIIYLLSLRVKVNVIVFTHTWEEQRKQVFLLWPATGLEWSPECMRLSLQIFFIKIKEVFLSIKWRCTWTVTQKWSVYYKNRWLRFYLILLVFKLVFKFIFYWSMLC